jgi:hypothetical protein
MSPQLLTVYLGPPEADPFPRLDFSHRNHRHRAWTDFTRQKFHGKRERETMATGLKLRLSAYLLLFNCHRQCLARQEGSNVK